MSRWSTHSIDTLVRLLRETVKLGPNSSSPAATLLSPVTSFNAGSKEHYANIQLTLRLFFQVRFQEKSYQMLYLRPAPRAFSLGKLSIPITDQVYSGITYMNLSLHCRGQHRGSPSPASNFGLSNLLPLVWRRLNFQFYLLEMHFSLLWAHSSIIPKPCEDNVFEKQTP